MSYLHTPRLAFSGDFQADVSTVNNDVRHYDIDTFKPRFQQLRQGRRMNGWWNPNGGASFRLIGCKVTQATDAKGDTFTDPADDYVIGNLVAGPGDRSSGKMVDIDPQWQMSSELWGLAIRVYTPDNELLLQGEMAPVGFRDLQTRQVANQGQNGQPVGATWTSVLTVKDEDWGKAAGKSQVLQELRNRSETGLLAVHLTSFGYYYAHNDGRFSMGRLLGTIGPYLPDEPRLFAPARRLIGAVYRHQPPNDPETRFQFSNFLWEEEARRLTLDLGESFPLVDPMGQVENLGRIRVAASTRPQVAIQPDGPTEIAPGDSEVIGEVLYQEPGWLNQTGGIVSFHFDGPAAGLLEDHQLLLLGDASGEKDQVLACESTNGLSFRADQNVHRLDPGQNASVDFYALQWGRPLPGARITLSLAAPAQSGGGPGSDPDPPSAPVPSTNIPPEALQFDGEVTTGPDGRATLTITGSDPGNPRAYIDGQIYQIVYQMDGLPDNQRHFFDLIVLHLRDSYSMPDQPTWQDVAPVLAQFGNLYPLMSHHIVDLGNRADVLKHRGILLFAFTRDIADPLYMPVTRDLSEAKLQTIVNWLRTAREDEEEVAAPELEAMPRAPLEPGPEDLRRPAAVKMSRSLFQEMTKGEGGKVDALKGTKIIHK